MQGQPYLMYILSLLKGIKYFYSQCHRSLVRPCRQEDWVVYTQPYIRAADGSKATNRLNSQGGLLSRTKAKRTLGLSMELFEAVRVLLELTTPHINAIQTPQRKAARTSA